MDKRRCFCWATIVAMWSACAFASPARAMVTFDVNISDLSCGKTNAAGQTFLSDCDTLSFAASIAPGDTAFLRASLNYHYTDDGLALPQPTSIQGDRFGFSTIPVTHEAGALYVVRTDCYRTCPFPPNVDVTGTPFGPLLLGYNEVPDDITGSLPLFVQMSLPADAAIGWSMELFLSPSPVTLAAPVPEPATLALTAAGLLALGLRGRRRGVAPQPC